MTLNILNFIGVPSKALLAGKMDAHIVPGITDKEFLEHEIKAWFSSRERLKQIEGERYYDYEQSILNRKRTTISENGNLTEVSNLPNHRIIDNQYGKMVDQKANYLCGKPITFDVENEAFAKELKKIFNRKMQRTINRIAKKAIIGGKVWMFPYYKDNNTLDFALFPAQEVLPFWADTEHTELDCAAHIFPVYVYDGKGIEEIVWKVEVLHGGGIDRFIWKDEALVYDNEAPSGAYITVADKKTGKLVGYNWERIPLICFKRNDKERPLLCDVKCLQDALNLMISNFVNNMDEDMRDTVLVIHNYDGENLGEFRKNLATFGAVKVKTVDGVNGAVETLQITVNAENYKTIIDVLKKSIIENAKGYDAKDERMNGTPNQMNIRSMYSDIDLDANGMETEFQAAMEELMWFIKVHLANIGAGDYENEDVTPIFNRDILINETEAIENCGKSEGIISNESILKQHPWVDDPIKEMERLDKEKKEAAAEADSYRDAFMATKGNSSEDDPVGGGNPPKGGALSE